MRLKKAFSLRDLSKVSFFYQSSEVTFYYIEEKRRERKLKGQKVSEAVLKPEFHL